MRVKPMWRHPAGWATFRALAGPLARALHRWRRVVSRAQDGLAWRGENTGGHQPVDPLAWEEALDRDDPAAASAT